MLYIVSTTGRCNLGCTYCGGSMPEWMMPGDLQYDVDDLARLVAADDDATVAFYGGEPLLRIPRIVEITQRVPARRFVLQTNGLLLDRVPDPVVRRLDTVLVSVDGRPATTDAHRGKDTHRRAMENVARLRARYRGDLVARMTATEATDIEADVLHLLGAGFDHVHWQLNAVWSPDGAWRDFAGWIRGSYNPGITRLRHRWLAELERGRVLGIAPFQGVLARILGGAKGLPCGAGDDAFAVATDGTVLACPIGPEYAWNRLADVRHATPSSLRGRLRPEGPCQGCDVRDACGGRCLFTNREGGTRRAEFDLACAATRHLVREVEAGRPTVERLLREGVVDRDALLYPPFNNTVEVIP